MNDAFRKEMGSYALSEPGLVLGSPMLDGEPLNETRVQVALSVLNRHGLVAGATGGGKTKTLQLMAGQLSDAGVPCFVADMKGDLTGLAAPGDAADPKLAQRCRELAWDFRPRAHPVELLSLSGKLGSPVRATVHSFGPVLLGKVMELNETQTSVLSLVFKYCDDTHTPLNSLADLRETLRALGSPSGKSVLADYGGMSTATVGVLLRAIINLQEQGADPLFGEPEFDVHDLLRTDGQAGVISVLELSDVGDKPKLFSTFMLWMLAQLWHMLPEVGDPPKPKLCFFFDEAHLLFGGASKTLLDEIEQTVRLIRSKGVGIYFVTQVPTDCPPAILAQLGNRVQHALRAFTAEDESALKKAARTYPKTEFYDVERLLTALGIGEAAVSVLSPRGVPTPLAATRLLPPDSLMGALDSGSLERLIAAGSLRAKYATPVAREDAHGLITQRIAQARQSTGGAAGSPGGPEPPPSDSRPPAPAPTGGQAVHGILEAGASFLTSRTGQELVRGVFGTLFGAPPRRRRY
jgi:DNA helicase HerA-like ATPase